MHRPLISKTAGRLNYNRMVEVLFVVVAAGVCLGMMFFPAISDDLRSMMPYYDYLKGTSDDLMHHFRIGIDVWHRVDYGRLTNFLSINTSWLPRWIPALISGFAVWAIMHYAARIGRFGSSPFVATFFVSIFLVIYPWVDQLYLIAFQINYIWSTALSIWIFYRILRDEGEKVNVVTCIVCLFMGFWHESFAAGVMVCVVSLIILYKRFRKIKYCVYAFLLLPGIYFLTYTRFDTFVGFYFQQRINILLFFSVPFIIFLILCGILVLYRKKIKNDFVLSPAITGCVVLGLTGTAGMLMFPTGPRTGALGILASLTGICGLLHVLIRTSDLKRLVRTIFTAVFTIFIFLHILFVDIECFRAMKATDRAISLYRENPSRTHFVEMTLRSDAPLICFQKPYYDWFAHSSTSKVFMDFYGIDEKPFRIAPQQLEKLNLADTISIRGSAGLVKYNGYYLGPVISDEPTSKWLEFIHKDKHGFGEYYILPLDNGSGLAWYYPNFSNFFKDINPEDVTVNILLNL